MLDVSRQSVSKWESQQTLPEPSKFILISQIFNVSIDQLLKDDMPMEGDEERTAANAEAAEPAPAVVKLDMMFCTQCGRENRADSAFCGYCGHPFVSFVADKPESGELTKTDMDLAYYKANLQMQQRALQLQEQGLEEARLQTEQQRQQLRLQRRQYNEMMKCPRCGSTSLSGNKKGYGIGKGVVGDALLGEVSFALVNGRVVRFTAYKDFPRFDKKNILARLGVEKGENCALVADTGTALRYRCPSEAVDDIWCNLIDNDTFGFLQVTYDMQYYEEWYLTLSNDEFYAYRYNTENVITSLLTFPESAEFPWNNENWHIAKNAFYVIVQSYVDAHNAFGAKVRNQFTCIYARTTGDILYAVFDGEVIADNGYVPTEELVFQLAGEGGG